VRLTGVRAANGEVVTTDGVALAVFCGVPNVGMYDSSVGMDDFTAGTHPDLFGAGATVVAGVARATGTLATGTIGDVPTRVAVTV
jgi:hypothetical protein